MKRNKKEETYKVDMAEVLENTGIKFVPVNYRGMPIDKEGKVKSGYSKKELEKLNVETIEDHKYVALSFTNSEYIGLDIDIKDSDPDIAEKAMEELDKVFGQFDGYHERSKGGYGLHAIVKDEDLSKKLKDEVSSIKVDKNELGLPFSVEIFGGHALLSLTGNSITDKIIEIAENVPKKIRENKAYLAACSGITSTEEGATQAALPISNTTTTDVDYKAFEEEFSRIDEQNRLELGYKEGEDRSKIDFAVACMALKVTGSTPEITKRFLTHFMKTHRGKGELTKKALENKVNRTVDGAAKRAPLAKQGTGTVTGILEWVKHKGDLAKSVAEKMGALRPLVKGMIFEGTLNTIVGKSGSGKSKMITIMCLDIAQRFPDKIIYYFGSDLSNEDFIRITELVNHLNLPNFHVDNGTTGEEFMEMIKKYGRTEDARHLVFVVDTVKKITPVNNKDAVSANLGMLKAVVNRGATGILIAHMNKDSKEMSGVAEFEQDVDNTIGVKAKYIGDDKMIATMSEFKRCRSIIVPITYEMSRDGFDFTMSDEVVDPVEQAQRKKDAERRGNIYETIISIVAEYHERGEELNTTTLRREIMEDDYYTGTRKTSFVSEEIVSASDEQIINTIQKGRSRIFTPLSLPDFTGEEGAISEEI